MGLKIGLTGGIASGKSTASNYLREKGIPVVDADLIARQAVEKGMPAYTEIIKAFGESILNPDHTINRSYLGDIIFKDEEKRKVLNSIVHPAVRKEMNRQAETYLNGGSRSVVLDIPLLFESQLTHMVDKTLLVFVSPQVQMQRLISRDPLTEEQAAARISSQMPLEDKIKLSDAVIRNDGTKDELYRQIDGILREWNII
ncbi:dephospho-CoA kinase [Fictibacillus aquaticus]|uniref:Dephospho-CoA kinase n=1 Tax=Fictibacillus aquaticus TaxID=2021314 RepID=A0A235FA44_9BACL|nr:dephospho-CoA kinase [Fictibacillus aquaticus]OYD58168.1 dephospho-CoA kinase [Fictibacillus aquaticus]